MKVGCLALVLAALVPAAASAAHGSERLDKTGAVLDVWPRKAFAGSGVRVFVRIPAEPENRRLSITIDSGAFARSSEIELSGDRAPQAYWFDLRALPPGQYVVEAIVYGSTRPRAHLKDEFSRL
jgi:hypothetical protein